MATLTLIEEGVILFEINSKVDFGLEQMLEVREANAELSKGKPYAVLMISGEFVNFTPEAKAASASPEHTQNRVALAILQTSMAMGLLTSMYLKINKPVGKTKAFSDREGAMNWLRQELSSDH